MRSTYQLIQIELPNTLDIEYKTQHGARYSKLQSRKKFKPTE